MALLWIHMFNCIFQAFVAAFQAAVMVDTLRDKGSSTVFAARAGMRGFVKNDFEYSNRQRLQINDRNLGRAVNAYPERICS